MRRTDGVDGVAKMGDAGWLGREILRRVILIIVGDGGRRTRGRRIGEFPLPLEQAGLLPFRLDRSSIVRLCIRNRACDARDGGSARPGARSHQRLEASDVLGRCIRLGEVSGADDDAEEIPEGARGFSGNAIEQDLFVLLLESALDEEEARAIPVKTDEAGGEGESVLNCELRRDEPIHRQVRASLRVPAPSIVFSSILASRPAEERISHLRSLLVTEPRHTDTRAVFEVLAILDSV